MDRDELKGQVDDLMQQYSDEEIDGETYMQNMMDLLTSSRDDTDDD